MWFDANAALAALETKQKETPAPAVSISSMQERAKPAVSISHGPKGLPERLAKKVAALPNTPPQCAVCGQSDWTVALTTPSGLRLHVICAGSDD